MGAFLEIKDLAVEYASGGQCVKAVNNVSFSLDKGETLGIVGETGAGKTTIAKSILRILPVPPAKIKSGEILLEGKNILQMPSKELMGIRGNRVSMIFQDPMTALNPIMRVGDQISEVISTHGHVTKSQARELGLQMLETVGIQASRSIEYPHQFSGGMKQRVVIAMALACNPKLLIADEPTTALDVTIQAQVLKMMKELKSKFDTSMLLITHDLGIVAKTCDEVLIMYAGEIVESGSLADIFDNPKHPYTLGLFGSLPSLDRDVKRLTPISGLMPDPADLPAGCKFHTRCPNNTSADDVCKKQEPSLLESTPGHFVRCHQCAGGERK